MLHLKQMSNTLTVRLPEDLAEWLDQAARTSGLSRGGIVRMELERARKSPKRPFMRLAVVHLVVADRVALAEE